MILRSMPWTALVALAAGAVACVPALGDALALDRSAVAAGEAWRWVSGHFVHWSADHAAWDIATFALLGFVAERLAPRGTWLGIALAVPAIDFAFWFLEPALASYRGLSGIDCALMALIAGELVQQGRAQDDARRFALGSGMAALLAGKILWELSSGSTLFVGSLGAGVVAVPVAHAAGAVAGFAAAWARPGSHASEADSVPA